MNRKRKIEEDYKELIEKLKSECEALSIETRELREHNRKLINEAKELRTQYGFLVKENELLKAHIESARDIRLFNWRMRAVKDYL